MHDAEWSDAAQAARLARRPLLFASAAALGAAALGTPRAEAASIRLPPVAKAPPPALRELRVPEAYPTVQAALAVARAGDHVSLADGTYHGDHAWSWTGGAAGKSWVVIKARNRSKAVLSGRIQLRSPYMWLHGLRTTYMSPDPDWSLGGLPPDDNFAIGIRASHVRVTRCAIASLGGLRIYDDARSLTDITIAYNDFTGARPNRFLGSQLYIGDVQASSRGPTEVDIAFNRFEDRYPHPKRLPDGRPVPINERIALYLGNSKPGDHPTGVNLSIRIHHNVLQGHRAMALYTKRHVYIGFNYVDTVAPPHYYNQVGFRHGGGAPGKGGIIEGNYVKGIGIFVNDTGARILGNSVPSGRIRLFSGAGVWDPKAGRYASLHQAASDTLLVGNRVPTYVLGEFRPVPETEVLLLSEGGRVGNVRLYMAGRGSAADAMFPRPVPLPDAHRLPGTLIAPYFRSTILVNAAGNGGHGFPTAVGRGLLTMAGVSAP